MLLAVDPLAIALVPPGRLEAHDAVFGSAEASIDSADTRADVCVGSCFTVDAEDDVVVLKDAGDGTGRDLCSVSFAACRNVLRSSFVKLSASSPGS